MSDSSYEIIAAEKTLEAAKRIAELVDAAIETETNDMALKTKISETLGSFGPFYVDLHWDGQHDEGTCLEAALGETLARVLPYAAERIAYLEESVRKLKAERE